MERPYRPHLRLPTPVAAAHDKVPPAVSALAFILLWVVVGLAMFLVAVRGGPRRARESAPRQARRPGRTASLVILGVYVGFGVALPTLVLAGHEEDNEIASEGITLTASEEKGRALFGQYCAQCHTLSAAKSVGKVGPDLDKLRPTYVVVANAVAKGIVRGNGTMPANLVTGEDVASVACFIERATHPSDPQSKQCKEAPAQSGKKAGGQAGPGSAPDK